MATSTFNRGDRILGKIRGSSVGVSAAEAFMLIRELHVEKGKYLIIPVEIIVRELESRLLLALLWVRLGYKIILGSTTQIRHTLYL